MYVPRYSRRNARQHGRNLAGIKADIEKINTNAGNVSVLLII